MRTLPRAARAFSDVMKPFGQVIAFGPFRLDEAGGRLLRGGKEVALRYKTFAVLDYLARRPGRLVPKDELLDAVWSDVVVTPSVLAGCIRELRRALGDDARAACFIETAHRRGYRFVASPVVATVARDRATEETPRDEPAAGLEAELAELSRRFALAVAEAVARAQQQARPARTASARRPARRARQRSTS
jgi:DNA-binding winged helix-turn-helix (wHTH) protein